jgi:copper chaperone
MKHVTLSIGGMTCGHCVKAVQKELGNIPGVVVDKVEIGTAVLEIDEKRVTAEMLAAAVGEAGYTVISAD